MDILQQLLMGFSVIRMFLDREIQVEGEEGKPGWVRIA
jgi:hypothetical protein